MTLYAQNIFYFMSFLLFMTMICEFAIYFKIFLDSAYPEWRCDQTSKFEMSKFGNVEIKNDEDFNTSKTKR